MTSTKLLDIHVSWGSPAAAELRILGSNLTDVDGYRATPSGVLTPITPRTVRVLLTVTFGPKLQ